MKETTCAMRTVSIAAALNGACSRALRPEIPDTIKAIDT